MQSDIAQKSNKGEKFVILKIPYLPKLMEEKRKKRNIWNKWSKWKTDTKMMDLNILTNNPIKYK